MGRILRSVAATLPELSEWTLNNFYISKTFKDVSNTLQNFKFIGPRVLEIAGGPADLPPSPHPLASGVGTKRLGTGGVKFYDKFCSPYPIVDRLRIFLRHI